MKSFTFKKEPKETGLRRVGNPYSNTQIKLNGGRVGIIVAPNWMTEDSLWRIRLTVTASKDERQCGWRGIEFKVRFETEPEARKWLQENKGLLQEKYMLLSTEI